MIRKCFLVVASIFLWGNLHADDKTVRDIQETYTSIQKNMLETFSCIVQNPSQQNMLKALKLNDATCKNILKLSEAPKDFKKILWSCVDEYRFIAAIIAIKGLRGEQYSAQEVQRIKRWDSLCKKVDLSAKKYGYKSNASLSGIVK